MRRYPERIDKWKALAEHFDEIDKRTQHRLKDQIDFEENDNLTANLVLEDNQNLFLCLQR